ncbi:hypothetical protein JCM10213v2_004500 [Rhodosporidiobolus nylandii]
MTPDGLTSGIHPSSPANYSPPANPSPPQPASTLAPSSHVSAASLAILTRTKVVHLSRLNHYKQIYSDHWGQPNLRVTNGLPHLPRRRLFGLAKHPQLVRFDYVRLSGALHDHVELQDDVDVIVFGSPGIGKTTFLSVKAFDLLERQEPFVLVDPTLGTDYFFSDVGVFELDVVADVDFQKPTFILVDSPPGNPESVPNRLLNIDNTTVVLASSPRSKRYAVLQNEGAVFWTMKLWDIDEVRAVMYLKEAKQDDALVVSLSDYLRRIPNSACKAEPLVFPDDHLPLHLRVRPDTSVRPSTGRWLPSEAFPYIGPLARPLFKQSIEWTGSVELDFVLDQPQRLANKANDLAAALRGLKVEDQHQAEEFHKYFVLQQPPEPRLTSNPAYQLEVATPAKLAYVKRSLRIYTAKEREVIVRAMMTQEGLKGFAYESFAIDTLASACPALPLAVSFLTDDPRLPLPHDMSTVEWEPRSNRAPTTIRPLLLIFPARFPTFDAAILPADPSAPVFLVKVTTASKHTMIKDGVVALAAHPEFLGRDAVVVFVSPTQQQGRALCGESYPEMHWPRSAVEDGKRGGLPLERAAARQQSMFRVGWIELDEGMRRPLRHGA